MEKIAQMPVVLIPVHFDRDPVARLPSCQRSVVLRPFITHDFMTGIPALPGKHIPVEVGGEDREGGKRKRMERWIKRDKEEVNGKKKRKRERREERRRDKEGETKERESRKEKLKTRGQEKRGGEKKVTEEKRGKE